MSRLDVGACRKLSSGPRCDGTCCRLFPLNLSLSAIRAQAVQRNAEGDYAGAAEDAMTADMVIVIGYGPESGHRLRPGERGLSDAGVVCPWVGSVDPRR